MNWNADSELSRMAAERWGVFHAADARRCGLDSSALHRRRLAGLVEELHRGVYRCAAAPQCFEQDLLALVTFHGPHAVASVRAAARLWDLPGFQGEGCEVSKPRGRSQRGRSGVVHGSMVLPPQHTRVHRGVPVTSVARTIFDLAGWIHPRRAERALDTALSRSMCTIDEVDAVFGVLARRGRRGTALMRELLEARAGDYVAPSSALEALARELIHDAGLPQPIYEANLGTHSDWVGRVDLLFREAKLVVELDGRRYHASYSDRLADQARDNKLMAAGFRVLRYSWYDLTEDPGRFIAEVRAALRHTAAA